MNYVAILWFLCISCSFSDIEAAYSTKTRVEAIRHVSNQLHSNCVILIMSAHSGMNEKLMLMNIGKHLGMYMAVLSSRMIHQGVENVSCRRSKPLYIIMDNDSSGVNELETIIQKFSNFGEMHWLVLSEHNIDPQKFLHKVDIPLDCLLMFLSATSLVEAVRVGEHLKLIPAGDWTEDGGLRWHQDFLRKTFFERRANLMGTVIPTTVKYEGTAGAFIRQENGTNTQVGGFFGNLWQELGTRLNFTSDYIIPGDYGEASWGKQLEMVMKGEAEVAVGAFIMTQHLLDHVQFLIPLGRTSVGVFVKAPTSPFSTNWNGYLAPFTDKLWRTFLIVILLLVLGLTFTYRVGVYIGNAEAQHTDFSYGFQESFLCVLGSFCQQGQETTPRSWPCRLVYFTSFLTAVVVMAAYSATFISFLTVNQVYLPFNTFDDLLHNTKYHLGAVNQSIELSFFQNATEDVLKKLYEKKMVPYLKDSPARYLEGFQRICDIPNYGFVCDSIQQVLLHQQIQCLTLPVPQATIPASGTFVISRESRFRRVLNNNLANMKESGELKRLFLNSVSAAVVEDKADHSLKLSVRLEEIVPALAFLAGSMVLSCLILLLERGLLTSGYKNKRRPPRCRRGCRQCYLQDTLLRKAVLLPYPDYC